MSEEKGFTQEDVNRIVSERVKEIKAAKDAEIGLLRQEVKDWQAKASEFDAVASEREALRSELAGDQAVGGAERAVQRGGRFGRSRAPSPRSPLCGGGGGGRRRAFVR